MTPRALFLDRDGTVIEDRHYLSDPAGVTLLPGVGPALARIVQAGWRLFLVSNQSGVGRGYFPVEAVQACQDRLDRLLAAHGVRFTDALWCPHAPEEVCGCRKPLSGMWDALCERHDLDPTTSAMIGDKLDDLGFAVNAQLKAGVLVLTGKGTAEAQKAGFALPESGTDGSCEISVPGAGRYAVARDMSAAVDWLLTSDFRMKRLSAGLFFEQVQTDTHFFQLLPCAAEQPRAEKGDEQGEQCIENTGGNESENVFVTQCEKMG